MAPLEYGGIKNLLSRPLGTGPKDRDLHVGDARFFAGLARDLGFKVGPGSFEWVLLPNIFDGPPVVSVTESIEDIAGRLGGEIELFDF
jgi:hypothetical protein